MAGGEALGGWSAELRRMAAAADRPDLVDQVDRARARLASQDLPVAVVGEYKQGKSTLVNAVLRTDVCPVDADLVTAVPTIVRYGSSPTVVVHPVDETAAGIAVPFERLREHVIEGRRGGTRLRAVEVRLDRRLLRTGLSFVDTPGVGGLDSAHGNLTLAAVAMAHAVLFVTDAAQELTAPELEFLSRAVRRCPRVACVLTKTDLHGEWRRILELDRGHLARAGLSVPVVPVSSFLRLRAGASDSTELNAESGFPRLLDLLRELLAGADAGARLELEFVVNQLREQVGAERTALRGPDSAAALTDRLTEQARRRGGLATAGAGWQTVLADGIQDLATEVDHDLRERIRLMLRRGEQMLDAGDPWSIWPDFTAWAAREASAAAVDNLHSLVARTEQLAQEVAERFELEYDRLDVGLPAPAAAVARVAAPDLRFERSSARQLLGAFTAARLAYGGMLVLGAFGSLLGLTLAAPAGVLAGLTVGRKLIREERRRQVELRRHQAKQELRRYVDEVQFMVGKDSRDAVRRTQRYLRDEFASRAALIERSSTQALAAVRGAAGMAGSDRARRAQELDARWSELDRVARHVGTS